MPSPFEIIVGPAEVYVAPVGEDFPDINDTPAGNWALVGELGSENYSENGVLLRSPRSFTAIRVLGSTTPRKHVITETGLQVEFDVLDLQADALALGYGVDEDDITDTAAGGGEPGDIAFDLPTSPVPYQRAVLVRIDQSPYGEGWNSQLEIPAANQVGNGEGGFTKSGAFQLKHIWDAVKTSGAFATWRFQDGAVSP